MEDIWRMLKKNDVFTIADILIGGWMDSGACARETLKAVERGDLPTYEDMESITVRPTVYTRDDVRAVASEMKNQLKDLIALEDK